MQKVKIGDEIIATDENKELVVTQIWSEGLSEVVDFIGTYKHLTGIHATSGEIVFADRGFSYSKNNWMIEGENQNEKISG